MWKLQRSQRGGYLDAWLVDTLILTKARAPAKRPYLAVPMHTTGESLVRPLFGEHIVPHHHLPK